MKRSFNDTPEDKLKHCCSTFQNNKQNKKTAYINVFFKHGCILKIYQFNFI